jgi:hypothetical protein
MRAYIVKYCSGHCATDILIGLRYKFGKKKKRIFVRATPVYKDEEREVCQTKTETVCRIESHVKFETLYGTRCSY